MLLQEERAVQQEHDLQRPREAVPQQMAEQEAPRLGANGHLEGLQPGVRHAGLEPQALQPVLA